MADENLSNQRNPCGDLEEPRFLNFERVAQVRFEQLARVRRLLETIQYKRGAQLSAIPAHAWEIAIRVGAEVRHVDRTEEIATIAIYKQFPVHVLASTSDNEILENVWRQVVELETHEAMEWFKVNGRYWKEPHPEKKEEKAA